MAAEVIHHRVLPINRLRDLERQADWLAKQKNLTRSQVQADKEQIAYDLFVLHSTDLGEEYLPRKIANVLKITEESLNADKQKRGWRKTLHCEISACLHALERHLYHLEPMQEIQLEDLCDRSRMRVIRPKVSRAFGKITHSYEQIENLEWNVHIMAWHCHGDPKRKFKQELAGHIVVQIKDKKFMVDRKKIIARLESDIDHRFERKDAGDA